MKRIYACLCIVAVLLGIAFYSSWRVQKFAEENGKRIRIPRDSRVRTITVIGMETGPAFTVMIPRM